MNIAARQLSAFLVLAALLVASPAAHRVAAQDRPDIHVVQVGETLYRIATQYGLSVAELQALNGITGTVIRVGQELRVGRPAGVEPSPPSGLPEPTSPSAPVEPGVRMMDAGSSLVDLAFRLGLPVDSLLALNPQLPVVFVDGDSVRVPGGFRTVTVRVRQGDTLFRIAERHGTTVAAIHRANGLISDVISVGQRLDVPVGSRLPVAQGLPDGAEEGLVIAYPERFEGRLMASGRAYDPDAFTVAHPTLDLGTVVLLTVPSGENAVFAEVADRMPARPGQVAEVSLAVAAALGGTGQPVAIRVIDRPGGDRLR